MHSMRNELLNQLNFIENETAKKSYAMVKNKEIEKIVKPELVGIDEYKTMKSDSEYSKYDLVIVLGLDSE